MESHLQVQAVLRPVAALGSPWLVRGRAEGHPEVQGMLPPVAVLGSPPGVVWRRRRPAQWGGHSPCLLLCGAVIIKLQPAAPCVSPTTKQLISLLEKVPSAETA